MKELQKHQEFKNVEYLNKFVFTHDDRFARAFESEKEISEYMGTDKKIEVETISKSNGKINIFLMIVHSDKPIDSETDLYELDRYERLNDCCYYNCTPCDYKPIKNG